MNAQVIFFRCTLRKNMLQLLSSRNFSFYAGGMVKLVSKIYIENMPNGRREAHVTLISNDRLGIVSSALFNAITCLELIAGGCKQT